MVDLDLLERYLLRAARERRSVTYGELLGFFERRVTWIHVAALCKDLGQVGERIAARGGPEMACLVVRKSDGIPGEGYFVSLREEEGYQGSLVGPEAVAELRRRQAAAFDYAAGLGEAFSDG